MTVVRDSACGSMILNIKVKCPAPSISAASTVDSGTCKKAFIIMKMKAALVEPGIINDHIVPTMPSFLMTMKVGTKPPENIIVKRIKIERKFLIRTFLERT
jgi:hypothetical protein